VSFGAYCVINEWIYNSNVSMFPIVSISNWYGGTTDHVDRPIQDTGTIPVSCIGLSTWSCSVIVLTSTDCSCFYSGYL